jgi:hypothetical protein
LLREVADLALTAMRSADRMLIPPASIEIAVTFFSVGRLFAMPTNLAECRILASTMLI